MEKRLTLHDGTILIKTEEGIFFVASGENGTPLLTSVEEATDWLISTVKEQAEKLHEVKGKNNKLITESEQANETIEKITEKANKTIALIQSYSKDSAWAKQWNIMYEIFQEHAEELKKALEGEEQ